MAYFSNFQNVYYKFGSENTLSQFPRLSTFVDIEAFIDDENTVYQKYTIQDNDRPDVVSYKLYGDPKFYWTFFTLNDSLRESGWPLGQQEAYDTVKKHYPHQTIVTESNWFKGKFKVGATVSGNTSGSTGKIVRTIPDLGQIVVATLSNFNDGEVVSTGTGTGIETITVKSQSWQYDSVHHYEDSNKKWVDIDPLDQQTSGLTKVTYMDRFLEFNDGLRTIDVLNKGLVNKLHEEFKRATR